MKVRITASTRIVSEEPRSLYVGDLVDLPEGMARELIAKGDAYLEETASAAEVAEGEPQGEERVHEEPRIEQATARPGEERE